MKWVLCSSADRYRAILVANVLLAILMVANPALAGIEQFQEDFEHPAGSWFTTGNAGFDFDKGLAHNGKGNGWVRTSSGWAAINVLVDLASAPTGADCSASAWIRVSPDVTDGYMSVRPASPGSAPGPVIKEIKLVGPVPEYRQFTFNFPKPAISVLFYVGLWGNGKDAWEQVDDVVLECKTPYPQ